METILLAFVSTYWFIALFMFWMLGAIKKYKEAQEVFYALALLSIALAILIK